MSPTALWMYVSAAILLVIGLIKIASERKIVGFARLLYAIPLAVFGSEHFTAAAQIAGLVPRWIPAHLFWVYIIGLGFLLAALSITTLVQARLAATFVGMTFLIFVLAMDIPGIFRHPDSRFAWALGVRQLIFSGGAFAFAFPQRAFPRLFVALPLPFYGVEHFLHPANVPAIPLEMVMPEWIPFRFLLSYFVGAILILAGICLILNWKTRAAAAVLGLTILLAILWVYLPIVIASPKDVEALNYFFDTLLFCGTILLLATRSTTLPA